MSVTTEEEIEEITAKLNKLPMYLHKAWVEGVSTDEMASLKRKWKGERRTLRNALHRLLGKQHAGK
jgi:hypothetical protein